MYKILVDHKRPSLQGVASLSPDGRRSAPSIRVINLRTRCTLNKTKPPKQLVRMFCETGELDYVYLDPTDPNTLAEELSFPGVAKRCLGRDAHEA